LKLFCIAYIAHYRNVIYYKYYYYIEHNKISVDIIASDDQQTTPFLLELRSSLPEIRDGEEVLARWSDEGWYYRGMDFIKHKVNKSFICYVLFLFTKKRASSLNGIIHDYIYNVNVMVTGLYFNHFRSDIKALLHYRLNQRFNSWFPMPGDIFLLFCTCRSSLWPCYLAELDINIYKL